MWIGLTPVCSIFLLMDVFIECSNLNIIGEGTYSWPLVSD